MEVSIPLDVLLSVLIVAGGCKLPNSVRAVLIRTATLAFCKISIVSTSTPRDITLRTLRHSVRIGPLGVGCGALTYCIFYHIWEGSKYMAHIMAFSELDVEINLVPW